MDTQVILCPYCGEELEVAVDWSIPLQEYIEDCQVCKRLIGSKLHEAPRPRMGGGLHVGLHVEVRARRARPHRSCVSPTVPVTRLNAALQGRFTFQGPSL